MRPEHAGGHFKCMPELYASYLNVTKNFIACFFEIYKETGFFIDICKDIPEDNFLDFILRFLNEEPFRNVLIEFQNMGINSERVISMLMSLNEENVEALLTVFQTLTSQKFLTDEFMDALFSNPIAILNSGALLERLKAILDLLNKKDLISDSEFVKGTILPGMMIGKISQDALDKAIKYNVLPILPQIIELVDKQII